MKDFFDYIKNNSIFKSTTKNDVSNGFKRFLLIPLSCSIIFIFFLLGNFVGDTFISLGSLSEKKIQQIHSYNNLVDSYNSKLDRKFSLEAEIERLKTQIDRYED